MLDASPTGKIRVWEDVAKEIYPTYSDFVSNFVVAPGV
jgi:hypothetical protein